MRPRRYLIGVVALLLVSSASLVGCSNDASTSRMPSEGEASDASASNGAVDGSENSPDEASSPRTDGSRRSDGSGVLADGRTVADGSDDDTEGAGGEPANDGDINEDGSTNRSDGGATDTSSGATDTSSSGGSADDTSSGGGSSSDTTSGGAGNDTSSGDGSSSDTTSSGAGNDTSSGDGSSSDTTSGGATDTGMVDARDTISSTDTGSSLTCSGNLTPCNGSCVDTYTNRNHCGGCGVTCSSKERCINGSCECPRYHKSCNGSCVPINTDPDNCGDCGNTCSSQEVCSAGQCESECLTGRKPCGQTCVDLDTDAQNCGQCGRTCPSGQGCVNGSCVTQVSTSGTPSKCKGGGPPIEVGFSIRGDKCLGNVAQKTFRWGICSCQRTDFKNKLYTDAFTSTRAPYQKGGFGGGVGSNGYIEIGNEAEINGALWTDSSRGIKGTNKMTIEQELHSGGPVTFDNTTNVNGDAYLEGNVRGKGTINFNQTLYLDGNASITNSTTNYATLKRQDVDVDTVCKRCQSSNGIPIGDIVDQHDQGSNDNQIIGLDSGALNQPGGKRRLELPCGEYYLSNIDTQYKTTIVVTGRTALYIGGEVNSKNDYVIKPTKSAELDLFVEGDVNLMNKAQFGSLAYPASMRAYVGGSQGVYLGNKAKVGAFFYARPGSVRAQNKMRVYGGLYVEKLRAKNDVEIHYDRAVLQAGKDCPEPRPAPDPSSDAGTDTGLDAGSGNDTSSTDTNGGDGSTCKDEGRGCGSDSECCSPLVCTSGECALTSCTPLDYRCSSDAECCSEVCESTGNGYSLCISG